MSGNSTQLEAESSNFLEEVRSGFAGSDEDKNVLNNYSKKELQKKLGRGLSTMRYNKLKSRLKQNIVEGVELYKKNAASAKLKGAEFLKKNARTLKNLGIYGLGFASSAALNHLKKNKNTKRKPERE